MTQRDRHSPSRAVSHYWAWADEVRWGAHKAMAGQEILVGPVSFSAVFYLPIPVSWARKAREAAEAGELPHTVKPDLKNLVAGVEDVLNGVVWNDDSQVVEYGVVRKVYTVKPGVSVVVQAVDEVNADIRALEAAKTLYLQGFITSGAGHG